MRKLTIGLVSCLIFFAGCLKNEEPASCVIKTLAQDMPVMTKFATDSAMITVQDESGLLYQVLEEGNEVKPAASSTVTVKYVGKKMNGVQFDANDNFRYRLSNLIPGWQIGIPKIGVGGKIKLIVPSSLAYGCNPYSPAIVLNQPLYFYVELLKVE